MSDGEQGFSSAQSHPSAGPQAANTEAGGSGMVERWWAPSAFDGITPEQAAKVARAAGLEGLTRDDIEFAATYNFRELIAAITKSEGL